jgi:hypothetical protein
MKLTDQPGRLFAILIFAPLLIYKGSVFKDNILIILGIVLFLWDLYWIVNYPPLTQDLL